MLKRLSMILLAPWLLAQGKRVRANTVRLPEAAGERWGVTDKGHGTLHLLCLGDSAAAGVGCETQTEAIMGQWVALYSETVNVHWQLVARSSLTCREVLNLLKETPLEIPLPVDQVLVSVGVNDVTRRTSIKQWRNDLAALTDYLQDRLQVKEVLFTALPPMHKFPALPQPLRWFIGLQAKELDHALQQHCAQHANTHYLAINIPFATRYMAKDGYHPSNKATPLWAKAAFDLINNK